MDKVQEVNERFSIICVIVGFILGIYLAVGHDNPDLWFLVVEWIFLAAFIMTFIPTSAGIYANLNYGEKFNISSSIRVFALNLAMIVVCVSFGFIFCSILIGNYNTAN